MCVCSNHDPWGIRCGHDEEGINFLNWKYRWKIYTSIITLHILFAKIMIPGDTMPKWQWQSIFFYLRIYFINWNITKLYKCNQGIHLLLFCFITKVSKLTFLSSLLHFHFVWFTLKEYFSFVYRNFSHFNMSLIWFFTYRGLHICS